MCINTMPNSKNMNSTTLTPHSTMLLNRGQTSMHGQQKRRRQQKVRFELDDIDNNSNVTHHVKKRTRVVELLPLSSELSPAEKQIRWVSGQEKEATSRLASLQAKESSLQDAKREQEAAAAAALCHCGNDEAQRCLCLSYRETYNNVFSACYQDQQIPPQSVALLAVLQDSIRGLEDRTVPLTALLRRKIRRMAIRRAITLTRQLKQQESQNSSSSSSKNLDERLGHLLRSMTEPAVQFARVLGLADAASVMMEDSDDNSNKFSSLVAPKSLARSTAAAPAPANSC